MQHIQYPKNLKCEKKKTKKSLSPINRFLNYVKDTPKYSCVCCKSFGSNTNMQLFPTTLNIIKTIIPLDKTLQTNNMLIYRSCERSINNNFLKKLLSY